MLEAQDIIITRRVRHKEQLQIHYVLRKLHVTFIPPQWIKVTSPQSARVTVAKNKLWLQIAEEKCETCHQTVAVKFGLTVKETLYLSKMTLTREALDGLISLEAV